MGQGPESLDRLGTLSLSKRTVEGQAISTLKREHPPSPRLPPSPGFGGTSWRDKNSLLQNPAVIDRRYRRSRG
jgi:hypothetical protein